MCYGKWWIFQATLLWFGCQKHAIFILIGCSIKIMRIHFSNSNFMNNAFCKAHLTYLINNKSSNFSAVGIFCFYRRFFIIYINIILYVYLSFSFSSNFWTAMLTSDFIVFHRRQHIMNLYHTKTSRMLGETRAFCLVNENDL